MAEELDGCGHNVVVQNLAGRGIQWKPCLAQREISVRFPSNTPDPPFYTIHKCRIHGRYLHGVCGEDPGGDDDCNKNFSLLYQLVQSRMPGFVPNGTK